MRLEKQKSSKKVLKEKRDALKKAYAAANEDPDRKKTMDDWKDLDLEGWDK